MSTTKAAATATTTASEPRQAPQLASVLQYNSRKQLLEGLEKASWKLPSLEASDCQQQQEEAERLQVLRDYQILDCPNVPTALQQLTERARREFEMPWAAISLIDLERQYILAGNFGLSSYTPRCDAFCAHTILCAPNNNDNTTTTPMLLVPDAHQDTRFCQNPYVTADPHIVFYAGVPLVSGNNNNNNKRLGAFCLLDQKPRTLSTQQQEKLRQYAKIAMYLLEERKRRLLQQHQVTNKRSSETQSSSEACCTTTTTTATTSPSSPTTSPPLKKSRSSEDLQHHDASSPSSSSDNIKNQSTTATIPKLRLDSTLPDPKKAGVDPDTFLRQLVQAMYGVTVQVRSVQDSANFFHRITEDQMAAYKPDIVSAARDNNISLLQDYCQQRGPAALNCFNRFGEGLLNLACRRGFQDMVAYLLQHVPVRTRDDYGRTPLHDACWHPEPQLRICTLLLTREPALFLMADQRGYTPFQYARSSDWHIWRAFLFRNRHHLVKLVQEGTSEQK